MDLPLPVKFERVLAKHGAHKLDPAVEVAQHHAVARVDRELDARQVLHRDLLAVYAALDLVGDRSAREARREPLAVRRGQLARRGALLPLTEARERVRAGAGALGRGRGVASSWVASFFSRWPPLLPPPLLRLRFRSGSSPMLTQGGGRSAAAAPRSQSTSAEEEAEEAAAAAAASSCSPPAPPGAHGSAVA